MRISHFFIERPIFAAVISIVIVLIGAIAYPLLPVAQYPNIVPPTVTITATYPGASAETVAETVAEPIEEQINGVEDMLYMSSQSTGDGRMTITCTFKLGTDLDKAQVLIQNRVAVAQPRLPQQVSATGVVVRKASPDFLLAIHFTSPDKSLDRDYIGNYVTLNVRDAILRVPGVGDTFVRGDRDFAIRVWIDPAKAAERKLDAEDITAALQRSNTQVAAGTVNQMPTGDPNGAYQLNIQTKGRLTTPEEFADIVIKRDADGRITRVSDIGRVELGAQQYTTLAHLNDDDAVLVAIAQLPGSNALETAEGVQRTLDTLRKRFPPGLKAQIVYNPTEYIAQTLAEVRRTLFEALALVVVVVIVFLQSWRAAIIPVLAIPISLVGTFGVMLAAGFSLNNLSMFGLVLAIGIVVDDAIVVIENVARRIEQGDDPRTAAHNTMDEVGGALIGIALVLCAVFVPAGMISGISGQFYRQFALTIATATLISLLVSLTLSPSIAAILMKPHKEVKSEDLPAWRRPLHRGAELFNKGFDRLGDRYGKITSKLVRMIGIMFLVYAGLLALTGWRLVETPGGFIPEQDQGNILGVVRFPEGTSLQRTDQEVMRDVVSKIEHVPGVRAISTTSGVDATNNTSSSNAAQMFVVFNSFEDRAKHHQTSQSIIADLEKAVHDVYDADVKFLQQPPVRGIGTAGGFKLIVEDRQKKGIPALEQEAQRVIAATGAGGAGSSGASASPGAGGGSGGGSQNSGGSGAADTSGAGAKQGGGGSSGGDNPLTRVFTTFTTRTPRIQADIDREKAQMMGVPDNQVFSALQTYLASSYINDFNYLGRTYQVRAQADWPYRQSDTDIGQLKTRTASGDMAPLSAFVTIHRTTGPYRVSHYNLWPAAEIQGSAAPGRSSGEALEAMQDIANKTLGPDYSSEWTELAYQQTQAGNTAPLVFAMAVVFVFLVLAALYESVTTPLAVILIVPMCLLAAIIGVNLRGLDNNILTQVGLVVLVGLAAKNAILIVEFAKQDEEEGQSAEEAAENAARTRLRPIIMTSLAFILGVIPLAFAQGAGSEMRQALGTTVFFGMAGVTLFGLLFTPAFYVATRKLSRHLPHIKRGGKKDGEERDEGRDGSGGGGPHPEPQAQ